MIKGFSKEVYNPIELMELWWPNNDLSHIQYFPRMRDYQYRMIQQIGSDGSMFFTVGILRALLFRLVKMKTCFKPQMPESWDRIKRIDYKIGPMRHVTVFGMIYLKCNKTEKQEGQRERASIPVISEVTLNPIV